MRKHVLLSATALGLILSGLMVLPAAADTTISSSITTPTKTSTAGNVTVDISAQITLTSGAAITVDSDNTVTLNGAIVMASSADNSTAILVDGAHASGLTINNHVTVTDDYTSTDTLPAGALDGILDYPYATGTGRYGVHSTGAGPFTGNVSFLSPYIMTVEGNNSYGFRFENQLNGNFSTTGTIGLNGDSNTAISLEKGVTGNVYISGTINYFGKDSRGVNLNGDIGGSVEIDAAITGSGYATITPSSLLTADQIAALPASDLQQSGALVTISGNVAKGILINTVPTTDTTNTSTDQDGDGVTDTTQHAGVLAQDGSAPALLIASSTAPITIGGVVYTGAINPPAINYGLLVRGSVASSGIYKGVSATTIQLGGLGQSVTIANGIGLIGQVGAASSNADSVGLLLKSGASTPQLDILAGGITTSTSTSTDHTTYGVDINAGATLPIINVKTGTGIAASGTGSTSGSVAIRDQSNSLTTINSNGYINSVRTGSDDDGDGFLDKILHAPIAVDTHTNTVGLTFNMVDTAPTDDTIAAPTVAGGFLLGSGDDHINFNGGAMIGDIDFGAGNNSFVLDGGALYSGKLTSTGTVNLNLIKGETDLTAAGTTLNLTNLHVGASSTLALTADALHPTVPVFTVGAGGSAVFDSGAKLDVQLNSILLTPQTFTLITAPTINIGSINTNLDGNVPYIYHATLNQSANALTVDFRLKTQAEGGYSDNQYAALVPVLTAAGQDPDGFSALSSQFTKGNFDNVFNQYLPDFSGENLLTLSQGGEALNQSLAALTMIPDNNGGQYWLQEYGFQTVRKKGYTNGFKATTFSFAGGRETRLNAYNMAGVYIGLTSGNPLDAYAVGQESMTDSDLTIGGYWRMNTGAFKSWAHAGLGFVQVESTRVVLNTNITRTARARWDGYSYSAGAGASYAMRTGFLDVTPQILVDYYNLNEAKHTETGGSDFFDLVVAERNSNMLSSQALINVSYNQWFVKPEVWFGWRQNVSADIADTVVNFPSGTPFTLKGGDITGGGPVAGFRFSADNQWSFFSFEGSYSKLDAYTDFSLSLRTRFQF